MFNSEDIKVSGRGKKCSRHRKRDSPAACGIAHGESGCPLATHGGPHIRAAGCALKEAVTHGKPTLLLAGPGAPWKDEPTL